MFAKRWMGLCALFAAALIAVACAAVAQPQVPAQPQQPAAPAAAQPQPAAPTTAVSQSNAPAAQPAAPLKPLKVDPVKGKVGDQFTISGEGLPAGKPVELLWGTWEGSFDMKPTAENVEFNERVFKEKRQPLGRATTDGQGKFSASFSAPEDVGETHDIFARIDGKDEARGGYRILRSATISSLEGPVGTTVAITIKGLAWKPFESGLAVRYDNKYTGFVSAVTTHGTASFNLRAAGPVGAHVIEVIQSSSMQPYLNVPQAPIAYLWEQNPAGEFRWTFNVTRDDGPPADTLEWPVASGTARDESLMRTTAGKPSATAASAVLEPAAAPILSKSAVRAKGLPPNADIDVLWVTARGNRLSPSGWNLQQTPLTKAKSGADGTLSAPFQVPDDLGGWHTVKLAQGETVLSEIPFYVERSLAGVTPKKVKAGETFTIQVKGIGWTELDNGFAATYDNSYLGYACGFNSNGDVTMTLTATGEPGTHLIDLYPMIFQGHGKPPWTYQVPQLTFSRDHPGLTLGYRLPAFRLAIEITK